MRQIYEGADHVLILDAQLNNFNATNIDFLEICTRLLFSSWTRRLCALQEGALARKLWVQLADDPVDLDRIQTQVTHIYRTQFIHNQLTLVLAAGLQIIRELGNRRDDVPNILSLKTR